MKRGQVPSLVVELETEALVGKGELVAGRVDKGCVKDCRHKGSGEEDESGVGVHERLHLILQSKMEGAPHPQPRGEEVQEDVHIVLVKGMELARHVFVSGFFPEQGSGTHRHAGWLVVCLLGHDDDARVTFCGWECVQ